MRAVRETMGGYLCMVGALGLLAGLTPRLIRSIVGLGLLVFVASLGLLSVIHLIRRGSTLDKALSRVVGAGLATFALVFGAVLLLTSVLAA